MPVTVGHVLSATTPDNTSYEIRPSHWNSNHAVTLNISGTDIIGAFSNSNNVSFGTTPGGYITATATYTVPTQSTQPVAISGSNSSVTFGTLTLGNSNGLSHYFTNGSLVGSYTVPTQSVQTQASGNIAGSGFATTTTAGTAVNGTHNSLGLTVAVPAYITTYVAQTNQTAASGNIAGVGTTFAGTNVSGSMTLNSVGLNLALSAPAVGGAQTAISGVIVSNTTYTSGTISFSNANGISFGSSAGQAITASYTVPTQTVQTQASGNIPRTGFSTTSTAGVSLVGTHDTNGLSLGVPNWITTYVAQTNQTVASGNIAGVGTTFAGTNVSGSMTLNSVGLNLALSAPAVGGAQTAISGVIVSNTTYTSGTISFSNANGISFGSSAGQAITASYTVPTQSVQPVAISGSNGSFAFSTLSLGSSNGATFYTTNGSVVVSYTTPTQTVQTQASGNIPRTGFTTVATAGSTMAGTHDTAGLNLAVPAWITTYAAQTTQPVAFSASGGSSLFSTLGFSNANGITFSNSAGSVVASYTVPSTAGLISAINISGSNTSQNVTQVAFANSNNITFGLSTSPGGPSGTFTASFSQSNQTGNIYVTANSTQLSSSAGIDYRSLSFAGAGIASVGVSNGVVLVSVPAGGGGGDGVNIVSMGSSGNTTGTAFSTLSGSIGLYASGALQISQNNSNQIVLIDNDGWNLYGNTLGTSSTAYAPNDKLYLSGGNNVTLSGNSNTVVISAGAAGGGITVSTYIPGYTAGGPINLGISSGTIILQQFTPVVAISMSAMQMFTSMSFTLSSTSSYSKGTTLSYGIYAQDTGTRSSQITLISSSSAFFTLGVNGAATSAMSNSYAFGQGTNSWSASTSGGAAAVGAAVNKSIALSTVQSLVLPFAMTLSAGGEYFYVFNQVFTTGGAFNVNQTASYYANPSIPAAIAAGQAGIGVGGVTVANKSLTNAVAPMIYSASSVNLPGTIAYSGLSSANNAPFVIFQG